MLLLPLLLITAGLPCAGEAQFPSPVQDLIGLWEAKRNFGPDVRGTLTLTHSDAGWKADICGFTIGAAVQGTSLRFEIPGDRGQFRGVLDANSGEIRGYWVQPPSVTAGSRYASPVKLKAYGENRWRGQVDALEDEFTLFLVASRGENGTVKAFLWNPERNLGVFLDVDSLERNANSVRLIGRSVTSFAAAMKGKTGGEEKVLAEGTYDLAQDRLSIYLPSRGGTYDFRRVDNDPASSFYARGIVPGPYRYTRPSPEDDGWPTGTLGEVGISVDPIRKLIENVIEPPAKSVHDFDIHGLLLARHGKLVLEEYFHGFCREKPHDTRSASKSLTATLVGSVIAHGASLGVSTPVYKTIYGDRLPPDLDPRKKAMTVENLLRMTSGYYCDDRDPAAPGNEDTMQDQTADPDWYHYTLNVPMNSNPGEQPVYCSADPNLLGDVLSHVTGKPLTDLFQERIADPLQIKHYYLNLSPTGEPYMGGGIYWLPRDFMKLGQVMLNGGSWNGQRIVSREWARQATSALENLRKLQYGYLWWSVAYPFKGKIVRAFFAGGNGGQLVMGIPDLDLVVAFYAGNYSDPVLYKIQEEFVPEYILPAIDAQN
ncbi:MAG: serine hydrolase [Terriglobales bacterium]